ncbi:MAG TPA: hypothetical protein VFV58_30110 [Blastocatellia bacterium]|nr:hypothetical protein [Blastocatellia bacterium]
MNINTYRNSRSALGASITTVAARDYQLITTPILAIQHLNSL